MVKSDHWKMTHYDKWWLINMENDKGLKIPNEYWHQMSSDKLL